MNTQYTSEVAALTLYRRAFPGTTFKTIVVREFIGPMSLNSYWDSGYRDYFQIVRIVDGMPLASIPQNGTPYDGKNLELSELPEGYAIAVHHYQGTKQAGSLYLNAANITPMLTAPSGDLPWVEKAVLACVCGLKSFARREKAARMGISDTEYDAAIVALKNRRLLMTNGGITNDGRNLVRTFPGCSIGTNFHAVCEMGGKPYRGW